MDEKENLDRFSIDYNAAENGVYLQVKDGQTAMNHCKIHTNVYYDNVLKMLQKATDRDEAIQILDEIREMLLDGTFPID